MARTLLVFASVLTVLLASFYQLFLKEFLFISYGFGRVTQPIEDFPYSCRRIQHEKLEACEDLWLDDEARILYAACFGTKSRLAWNPAMLKLNVSGRRPHGSELIALDIDSPDKNGLFPMRTIKPVGYVGATGNAVLDIVGFDAEIVSPSTIHFYFTNGRPPVGADKEFLDATKVGSNATIDIFEYKKGGEEMKHLRTIWTPEIWSPNRVAVIGQGAFVITNDHTNSLGIRRELDPILGGGNVVYCSSSNKCHSATPDSKFKFPNGLSKGKDGRIYVPSSLDGTVRIFELQSDKMLKEVNRVYTRMGLDNISPDANGDLWAPGFPNIPKLFKNLEDPFVHESPSTVFRITKKEGGYEVEKVIEDEEGKVLSMVTTVRHDAKTGRLFMGSAVSPFIMVCDPIRPVHE